MRIASIDTGDGNNPTQSLCLLRGVLGAAANRLLLPQKNDLRIILHSNQQVNDPIKLIRLVRRA